MPACKDTDLKYLRELSEGISIEIPQIDYKEVVSYRQSGGVDKARQIARTLRDSNHLLNLGREVSKKTIHSKKRQSKRNESKLPNLKVGISYGYSRGKLLYTVVTTKDPVTLKDKKIRFNIKKLGLHQAIRKAEIELDKRIDQ